MSTSATITLSFPEPDIAQLTLDMPNKGANVFSRAVLEELESLVDQLDGRRDLAGVVICSGKPGIFIAGADIREFVESLDATVEQTTAMSQRGQDLFRRLQSGPYVSVAAIDGVCLGGGAELAIWCDRRIMSDSPKTQFGFPEVKLGLFPGWGGTARAPRIVGLANAVELITGGEAVDGPSAVAMGLASGCFAPDRLLDEALRLVRAEHRTGQFLRDRETWKRPIDMSETELGFLGITASTYIRQQTKGHYPAPMAALELMMETAGTDCDTACRKETEGFVRLFGSPVNAALLNVFFLTDRNKKDRGVASPDVRPLEISSVGVVGAGIMGSGIAASNIRRRLPVALIDASREALERGARQIMEEVAYDRRTRGPSSERALEYAPLLKLCTADAELAPCQLVIEAIVENRDVKRKLYERLEPILPDSAILASNTSTIPISQLAESLARPDRFCGIHFFNPVRQMKLVEVIRGARSSDTTIATAVAHAKLLGKHPIVVNDGPGFLVNRLLLPYMNEAVELLCEGVELDRIERIAKKFGMPMGPITLFDVVGLDTAVYAGRTMWEAFPDRIVASPLLPAMVKAGRLGQKSGAGFFAYGGKRGKGVADPAFHDMLAKYRQESREFSDDEITHRLFLPMLLEATRVLEESIVRDPRDVDLGLIFGIGFPPFKGGLMFWADTVGASRLVEMLKPLEYLGARTQPTPMLLDMASTGQKFYSPSRS